MSRLEINTSDINLNRSFRNTPSMHTHEKQQPKPAGKNSSNKMRIAYYLGLAFFATTVLSAYISMPDQFQYISLKIFSPKHVDYLKPFVTYSYSFDDSIDADTQELIDKKLSEVVYEDTPRYCNNEDETCKDKAVELGGEIIIKLSTEATGEQAIYASYIPVGHFYWIRDAYDLEVEDSKVYVVKGDAVAQFIVEQKGLVAEAVEEVELLEILKASEETPALIALSDLSFEYKLLTISEQNYLDELRKDVEKPEGALNVYLAFKGEDLPQSITSSLPTHLASVAMQTVDSKDIYTINQTGVTAITRRQTPLVASSKDGAYPARKIGEFLADANLTHVSNEISFVDGCTNSNGMVFCSLPETIDALKFSGVDVVELTGNHNNDYGAVYNTSTIEDYKEVGMGYFGGGLNAKDALKPYVTEITDGEDPQEIAFLGYNYWNAFFNFTGALASDDRAGANPYDEAQMKKDITELKEQGKYVIVDFQFSECYSYPEGYVIFPTCYRSDTVANQETVFKLAIGLGADMVVGSQAHQPQTYEIYKGKPIFYGLGNLFFDQTMWPGTKHGLVLTHYFIDGKYVQTKLSTTNYESDLKTYVTTGKDRTQLLELLQEAR